MFDILAGIFEFIAMTPVPMRVVVALLPTFLISGFVYWVIPNKTVAAWVLGILIFVGAGLGIWWHNCESKYDHPA
jgi:hypothetical protein